MFQFPIGVMLEAFRIEEDRKAIECAAKLGAKGLQIRSTTGAHAPENMTAEKIRELNQMIRDQGLVVSALCGDFGKGFWRPEMNRELIEKSKRVLELGLALGTNIITTHIGVIPEDPAHPRYGILQEACFQLADYADSMKAHFAVETGPEVAATLKRFLDSLQSQGVAVNMDPANLVMITEDDPAQAVYTLRDYIVHTHAKDGIKLFDRSPEIIYKHDEQAEVSGRSYQEKPLGSGKVDFKSYLKALNDIGYRGFLTIEREVGENPIEDIKNAVIYLEEQLGASRKPLVFSGN